MTSPGGNSKSKSGGGRVEEEGGHTYMTERFYLRDQVPADTLIENIHQLYNMGDRGKNHIYQLLGLSKSNFTCNNSFSGFTLQP